LLDEGGRLSASLGVRAVPWTLAVDRAGVIRLARQGIVRAEELEATLRRLVTSAGDAPGGDAAVYLTFDDFPAVPPGAAVSPDEELLDILRAAGVPTTFFCIGEHLTERAGAAAARRAAREGHSLQMHAWSHDAARPDLRRCVRIIADVTGRAPTLYRPPGSTDLLCADGVTRAAGAARSSGTLAPYDHMRPGRAELTRRVLFGARTGTVIQLHAGVPDTRDALPGLLDTLRRRGLTFATLG
jgi:peptidoglycan/xylan/chitin deacetylase (PgdA/CDA1 family)